MMTEVKKIARAFLWTFLVIGYWLLGALFYEHSAGAFYMWLLVTAFGFMYLAYKAGYEKGWRDHIQEREELEFRKKDKIDQ